MSTESFVLLLVIALLIAALPTWRYSRAWGYAPSGVLSLVLVVFLVMVLAGQKETRTLGQDVEDSVKELGQETRDALR